MDDNLKKKLSQDTTGLATYEYIANHMGSIDDIMGDLVDNIIEVDRTGQFIVSTARYLHAIDNVKYAGNIDTLIKAAMGLLGPAGQVTRGDIWYRDNNLPDLSTSELRRLNGPELGIIFQMAGGSFCPIRTVGSQIYE
ncbi:MAG: hypothetical protein IJ613_10550, partial [Muribaculaceae bacterium]|nr:hypothetical protein [Muribaculaceae bacterium]